MFDLILSVVAAWFDWFNHGSANWISLYVGMTTWVRYVDFEREGLFKSRQQLKNAIDNLDFPPGRLISPNVRAWDKEREVDPWIDNRPSAPRPTPKSPGRPRKHQTES